MRTYTKRAYAPSKGGTKIDISRKINKHEGINFTYDRVFFGGKEMPLNEYLDPLRFLPVSIRRYPIQRALIQH